MHGHAMRVGLGAKFTRARRRHYRTTGQIVRVFQGQKSCRRNVIDGVGVQRGRDVVPVQMPCAVAAFDGPRYDAGNRRHRRHLVIVDVAALFDDDFLARLCVQFDGDLVAH